MSNPSFSYVFRPWLHRQSCDIWKSSNSTLPLNSAALVQLFAASPWIKSGNWSQLKINQHFILFFLRITFQAGSDPQSIVQLYKQLYQHKVPELLMAILVPKANICIPSSPHLMAAVEQDHWPNWTRRGLDCHCLQLWRVSSMRQNEVTLMSTLQLRHGYSAPASCCLSKIICHFCSLHAEIKHKNMTNQVTNANEQLWAKFWNKTLPEIA